MRESQPGRVFRRQALERYLEPPAAPAAATPPAARRRFALLWLLAAALVVAGLAIAWLLADDLGYRAGEGADAGVPAVSAPSGGRVG